jgi:hypothetical protein
MIALKEPETLAHFIDLELGAAGCDQCPDILEVQSTTRVIDEALCRRTMRIDEN